MENYYQLIPQEYERNRKNTADQARKAARLEKLPEPGSSEVYVKFEGANMWAALHRALDLGPGKKGVTVVVYSGLKYLQGDLY